MKVHVKSAAMLCCQVGFLLAFSGAAIAESLNISGDYVVPAEGASVDNVTVSATATVSGGAITLANGGRISVTAGTATFSCPIVLGVTDSGGVTIAPDSGATVRFNGAISGPADIDVNGAGTIYFSGANTFDGDLVITRGVFHADGNGAFGSTAGTTTLNVSGAGTAAKIHFDAGTWDESFFLSQGGTWGNWTVCFNGPCTFNGPVTCANASALQWWWFAADARVVFNGGFNAFGGYYAEAASDTARITYNCAMQASAICLQKGTHVFSVPLDLVYRDNYNTNWKNARDILQLRPGTFVFGCVDALGESGNCARYFVTTAGATTIQLLEDQHVSHMVDVRTANHVITSEAGNILHVDSQVAFNVSSQGFSGRLTGNVGLSVEGPLPMTLSGVSTTSGPLVLTNGAQVALGNDASWAGKIVIANDGGEKLTLPDSCSMTASELWVGGARMADGEYGGEESTAETKLACFGGRGVFTVRDQMGGDVACWTGGGATASVADGDNWDIGREPDRTEGKSVVTFASSVGESAEISHDVFWKSVAFSDRSAFALTGSGLVSLADGISIAAPADSASSRRFTVSAPYRQLATYTTTVPANTTLAFGAVVSSPAGAVVGFDGAGTVELNAANAFGGTLRFDGSLAVLATHGAALDATDGTVAFNNSGTVDLRNVSIPGAVSFTGAKTVLAPANVTNVFAGPVTFSSGMTYTFFSRRRQKYRFCGGLTTTAGAAPATLYVSWDKGCNTSSGNVYELEISGTPVSANAGLALKLINTYIETVVAVSSNRFGAVKHEVGGNVFTADGTSSTRLRCAAPYAFNYDCNLILGISSNQRQAGYLDLGGFDQGFAEAVGHQKEDAVADHDHLNVVHSATPALLCTRHAIAAVNRWTFTGAAGYRMEGSGSVTLKASSESTGELCVTNGTLSLAPGCLWPNCSRVVVSDAGTFEIASADALGRKTDVSLSGEGGLHLAEGVDLKVHSLWIDGVERSGVWGSPESGADYTDSRLSGKGTICGRIGFAVFIR